MRQIIILLLVCFYIGCVSKSKTQINKQLFKIDAKYSTYVTAMGKGKGIIFRINFSNNLSENFQIDSFYVNGKLMPFVIKNKTNHEVEIEANYLKSVEEPGFSPNSNTNNLKDLADEIIEKHQFYPSWVIVLNNHKKIKITIENYKLTE